MLRKVWKFQHWLYIYTINYLIIKYKTMKNLTTLKNERTLSKTKALSVAFGNRCILLKNIFITNQQKKKCKTF